MNNVKNTKQDMHENPVSALLGMMVAGSTGFIESQEAQGQQELCNSEVLPIKIEDSGKRILEKYGVRFLGPVVGDDLFQNVQLPIGWSIKPTEHSMWSKLFDGEGRERAAIFYKAAFYDRSAFMRLTPRYKITGEFDGETETSCRVVDGDNVLFETETIKLDGNDDYEKRSKVRHAAIDWMKKHFPLNDDCDTYYED